MVMNKYVMKRLSELGEVHALQAATIFTDCVIQYFKTICKDREHFTTVLLKALVREQLWVCVLENEVVGLIVYTTLEEKVKVVRLEVLKKEFGFIKGHIAYSNLTAKPKKLQPQEVYLEFVFTSENYRKQGVATTMLYHVFDTVPSNSYTLEVTDVNEKAIKLYEKLGFIVTERNKQPFAKQVGFNERLYMKRYK